ncbi:MAG TPA: PaaI family thioesterase, partial [Mycobacterium sp.]|nr:PaaI family thioesterase [Mycobacterium sp.]
AVRGRVDSTEGRKAFVSGELTNGDGTVLAEGHGLMVRLLPGQP